MKKNKALLIGALVIAIMAIALGVVFGKQKKQVTSNNPEFAKYIYGYTAGVISKTAPIKIKFNEAITQKDGFNYTKLFDFSPSVNGSSYWLDEKTLEFKPDENFPSNTSFIVEFALGDVINVPENLKNFSFEFKTLKQSFDLNIEEVKTIDRETLKWQKIIGVVQTADSEDGENIEKLLSGKINGKELKINWQTDIEGLVHRFEIDSIERTETAGKVLLSWFGEAIQVDKTGTDTILIPALGDFTFLSAKVIQQPEQYLKIQFSDPLLETQNINGLVSVGNLKDLRYVIEDNLIKVYPPDRLSGNFNVSISQGIKNVLGFALKEDYSEQMTFEELKPEVRLVNNGVILPNSPSGLVFPFEAVNLKAVDVRIIRIYEGNIMQFLQVNEMEGESELKRVGKTVLQSTVDLNESNIKDLGKWNRFSLDLNEMISAEPGAIYRITIGFRKKNSLYACIGDEATVEEESDDDLSTSFGSVDEGGEQETSYWDGYDDYYYEDYNWEDRDDPCKDAYYGSRRSVSQNIIASNLGLIAKKGNDGSVKVFVTDILTTSPLKDITIDMYDFQQQLIKSDISDDQGIVSFTDMEDAYFIVAKSKTERGYLKLNDGTSLSLSRFDIAGVSVNKGLKGYLYGERGVWRPGDSVFVTFVLEEAEPLPASHPIVFELRNPLGQVKEHIVTKKSGNGYHIFRFKTEEDDPTGNWEAKVTVGGIYFYKSLKIETVKPNRLKIKFDFESKYLTRNQTEKAIMNVKWLHGAKAKNLQATVDVILNKDKTYFEKFKDYVFEDPTKDFETEQSTIFEGSIDEEGNATVTTSISAFEEAPGVMSATFLTKVFENGGNFSTDRFSLTYHPFKSYTGIKLPKGDKVRGMLLTDTNHVVNIVTVTPEGELDKEPHTIEIELYKIEWKWWWDNSTNNQSSYSGTSYNQLLQSDKIITKNGEAKWTMRVNYPDWGRYMVCAKDLTSGHSTAKIIYIDWPGWAGRAQSDQPGGVSMLNFTTDKKTYKVGEQVELVMPSSKGGRALISIENGSGVVQSFWKETEAEETRFTFNATSNMSPNVYINITMLQPHAQTANDLPIRLYGVFPISVEDPETHLEPRIEMPEVLRPEESVKIKVREHNNKDMTYTLAIVDEGLLDLTRYKTPDLWSHFFAREALGVKSWDLYNYVIGAYGGEIESLLAIGGDDDAQAKGGKKAERFKPMVRFMGPYHLKGGSTNTHVVNIPRYVGSVRTMVVAGYDKTYGSAEKTTPVRKPLMLLGTLPRVLGPGETVKLPVSAFAMEENIKNVTVTVKTNDLISIVGSAKKELRFSEPGEENIEFDLQVNSGLGIGKVIVEAVSGKEKATFEIEIDVRTPNPRMTNFIAEIVQGGKEWQTTFNPIGIKGTNKGVIEISSIPPLNLEKRLDYLIKYPHGCVEQTTSGAFPQLFLSDLMDLNEERKSQINKNIKYAIQRLSSFQLASGGLGYWPGATEVSDWGTNYAGHFLIEAERKGYMLPASLKKGLINFQSKMAGSWVDNGQESQLIQAYRLYMLALADKAEIGAMNRLKERSNLSKQATWRLAAAYLLAGKDKIALKMIENLDTEVKNITTHSNTFGSDVRDKAMILETLSLMGKKTESFVIVKELSEAIGSQEWYSTQTTAYSLIAISKYVGNEGSGKQMEFTWQLADGKSQKIKTEKSVSQVEIKVEGKNLNLKIQNNGTSTIYARLILSGIPEIGETTDSENDLKIYVSYMTTDGISIEPEMIEQGTDFVAEVRITHPGVRDHYKELALTQIFPSGWEIINTRMLDLGDLGDNSPNKYRDIRDDRVYTYFDLNRSESCTYRVMLNASYTGRFYLPTVYCEAMYDNTINARKKGRWVEVVKAGSEI